MRGGGRNDGLERFSIIYAKGHSWGYIMFTINNIACHVGDKMTIKEGTTDRRFYEMYFPKPKVLSIWDIWLKKHMKKCPMIGCWCVRKLDELSEKGY